MKVDVVMPKMGESLQEGTIIKWLKNVGEKVERDEMILEISKERGDEIAGKFFKWFKEDFNK